eukprot:TRINITY_DN51361_c0_g1_i1.p1 TRINITY_DN51361_c0_g1~~TRINITY_DN51361_c0_g1_i1.p1  ORF type:complete len:145 (-),score=18.43 TRINITY_DN51361_c0_g1_i1:113-547(-)
MGTSSAITLLAASEHDAGDVVLGVVFMVPLCLYTALYIRRTIEHPLYCKMSISPPATTSQSTTFKQRAIQYLLEPTHDSTHLIKAGPMETRWLSSNYYFIEDRRLPLFGGLEVLIGLITNAIDGIPIISANTCLLYTSPSPRDS